MTATQPIDDHYNKIFVSNFIYLGKNVEVGRADYAFAFPNSDHI
jgi:hypothetical protein